MPKLDIKLDVAINRPLLRIGLCLVKLGNRLIEIAVTAEVDEKSIGPFLSLKPTVNLKSVSRAKANAKQ